MAERIKVCGLWMNKSKDGVDYLTGKFSPTMKVLIFKNNFKQQGDNSPTHIMYFAPVETDQAAQRGEGNDGFFGEASGLSDESSEGDDFTSAPAAPARSQAPQRNGDRPAAAAARPANNPPQQAARPQNPRPVQNTPPQQRRAPQPAAQQPATQQDDMGDFEDPFEE